MIPRVKRFPLLAAVALVGVPALTGLMGCAGSDGDPVPGHDGVVKSSAAVRADRRAYDGAPPTIPHESFDADCANCHNDRGRAVTGVGFAPASPHEHTRHAGATQRCRQCHVFRSTDGEFVKNRFVGTEQDLSAGDRATAGAPPRIPHRILMRESCLACHDGPGAREAIRTSHPERTRCRQCHVPIEDVKEFHSALDPVGSDLD